VTSWAAPAGGPPREPLADYVVVPDAGHASNQDNPEAFNAALTAFLAEALRPATTVPDDGGGDRMVRPQRRLWDRLRRRAS
jgi:hypothetical protein